MTKREKQKQFYRDHPEVREHLRQLALNQIAKNPDRMRQISKMALSPEARAKHIAAVRLFHQEHPGYFSGRRVHPNCQSVEAHNKRSQGMKRQWSSDPERAVRHSQIMRKWWAEHPEHRQTVILAMHAPEANARRAKSLKTHFELHPELMKRIVSLSHTPEANQKRSCTMITYATQHPEWVEQCRQAAVGNRSNTGRPNPHLGQSLDEIVGAKRSAEIRLRISEAGRNRRGFKQSKEWVARRVAAIKATANADPTIQVRRVAAWRKGLQQGKFQIRGGVGKAQWYQTPDGQWVYMRSTWEVKLAKFLTDQIGCDWQYEPQRFDLGEGIYIPDFYLPNFDVWVEIKGRTKQTGFVKDNLWKTERFKSLYPSKKLIVLRNLKPKTLDEFRTSLITGA